MGRAARIPLVAAALALLAPAQDFPNISIEQIGRSFVFTEGPAWSKDGYLLFSDTPADRLLKWTPGREPQVYRENAGGPSGNAFDGQGRLYTCETRARRVTLTDKSGRVETVAERFEGKRLNAPNDLAVSRNGHVYFTDPAFGGQQDHRELDFYGVYHLPPRGPLKLIAKPEGRPNGIAISANGRTLYVTNSDERNIRAYDLDRNGDASNERILVPHTDAIPGGIRVSEKGELYVATAKGITIYSADGRLVRSIEMHERPSNCAFDAEEKYLYVSARGELVRLRMAPGEDDNRPGPR